MEVKTVCPHCCLLCDLYLKKGREIEGVSFKGPLCPKGILSWKITYHRKRLLRPMQKGKRGYKSLTWEQATAVLVRKVKAARKKVGVVVSGACTDEEIVAIASLARALGTKVYTRSLLSTGLSCKLASSDEIEKCDAILMVGDPFEQFPVIAGRVLKAKYERGIPIFSLSSRAGPTSWFSQLIQPRPGTESVVLCLLAKMLVESGRHKKDCEAIEKFDTLKTLLSKIKAEELESLSGVRRMELEVLAAALSRASRPLILLAPTYVPVQAWVSNLALLSGASVLVLPGAPTKALEEVGARELGGEEFGVALVFREDPASVKANFKAVFTTYQEEADLLLPVPAFTELAANYTRLDGEKVVVQPASEPPEGVRGIDLLVRDFAKKMKVKLQEAQVQAPSKITFSPVKPQAILPERNKFPFFVASLPTCFNPEWKVLRVQPEFVEISPPDAERLGLKESQRVVVGLGEEQQERVARVRPSVPEGTVYISDFKVCAASLEAR
jgi:predicted molibdopterin-dependent oxidoreductase YjgC